MKIIRLSEAEHKNLVFILNNASIPNFPIAGMRTIVEVVDKVANAEDEKEEEQKEEEKEIHQCEVCWEEFENEEEYYTHYDEVHNKNVQVAE